MNEVRRNGTRTALAALIAGFLVSHGALAAQAVTDGETVSRTVDIRGLDLASTAGAQRAYDEITAAAEKICAGPTKSLRGVARAKARHDYVEPCVSEAVHEALAEIEARTGIDVTQVIAKGEGLVATR